MDLSENFATDVFGCWAFYKKVDRNFYLAGTGLTKSAGVLSYAFEISIEWDMACAELR